MIDPLSKLGMNAGAKPQIFINARILRKRMTEPEKKLWEFILTNPFGVRFRRQHPFGRYILDFYCHSKRISIEIDGLNHLETKQQESDIIRTEFVNSMGVQELRFTNGQVLNSFPIVSKTIKEAIELRNIDNSLE